MVPQILDLAEDENVKGLVLRVNSGGGSAFASEQIWRALQEFKKKGKPFYVSMGDYAASGGYYISCGADSIFADTNTLTGSIGIFGLVPCAQGLLNNHLGVNFSTVATNDNAVISMWAPMNDDQKQAQQAEVEQGYKLFTSRVAEGRKLKIEDVLEIAEGRVWDGKSAIKIHLIDRFGTLNDAVIAMAKKVGLTTDDVVNYPRVTRSAIQELILNSGVAEITARPSITIPGVEPKEIIQFLNWFDRVKSMSKVQARMEDLKVY
jgi:protease-4